MFQLDFGHLCGVAGGADPSIHRGWRNWGDIGRGRGCAEIMVRPQFARHAVTRKAASTVRLPGLRMAPVVSPSTGCQVGAVKAELNGFIQETHFVRAVSHDHPADIRSSRAKARGNDALVSGQPRIPGSITSDSTSAET